MTTAEALVVLFRRGWTPFVADGRARFNAPTGDRNTPEAAEALAVLRRDRVEAVALLGWWQACIESVARFGRRDAVLYPFIGREVATSAGPALLLRVLSGRAEVHRSGAERAEIVAPADLLPPPGGAARAV